MKDQPDFIGSEFPFDENQGVTCMYGNCYPLNFFTEKQWKAVYELAANIVTNQEFYHEKEIKLLRSKHRKAVKKLKEEHAFTLSLLEDPYSNV